jgi:hypothetical protein
VYLLKPAAYTERYATYNKKRIIMKEIIVLIVIIGSIFQFQNTFSQEIEFEPHAIVSGEFAVDGAWSVYAADVDGDGDMDVLSASSWDDKIAWYENDGDENFNAHTITTSAHGSSSVYAADVDGDGDMDVLSASLGDDKIAWYENDGDENFNAHTITTNANSAKSVYAVDVDGDGDMDVLSASALDDKIAWYENLQDTGINQENNLILKFNNLKNFPNPFNPSGAGRSPTTTISFSIPNDCNVELSIYNIKGQKIKTLFNNKLVKGDHSIIWNGDDEFGNSVSSGLYFYKLKVNEKTEAVKKCLLLK